MRHKEVSLALKLFDCGAVKIGGEHRLRVHKYHPELPPSPIYLNLRTPENPKPGPLTKQLLAEIGGQLLKRTRDMGLSFEVVRGIPNAGKPIAEALVIAHNQPIFEAIRQQTAWIRKKEGRFPRLRGTHTFPAPIWIPDQKDLGPGKEMLLVDDVIGAATTKELEIAKWQRREVIIAGIAVVIDREEGGRDKIQHNYSIPVVSLFQLSWLLDVWLSAKRISRAQRRAVLEFQELVQRL